MSTEVFDRYFSFRGDVGKRANEYGMLVEERLLKQQKENVQFERGCWSKDENAKHSSSRRKLTLYPRDHQLHSRLATKAVESNTILSVAAIVGNLPAASMILMKDKYLTLIQDSNNFKRIPLIEAARHGQKKMIKYLLQFSDSYLNFYVDSTRFSDESGVSFLNSLIIAGFYGLALKLLKKHGNLATKQLSTGESLLSTIAGKPSAFRSGQNTKRKFLQFFKDYKRKPSAIPVEKREKLKFYQLFKFVCYKKEKGKTKSTHHQALLLVKQLCKEIIENQDNYGSLPFSSRIGDFRSCGRNLAPKSQLNRIPRAAIRMQHELQWYKEMEKLVPPDYKEEKNSKGETPRMVFMEEHKGLVKEGEKWMKESATSFSLAAALIATIVSAAAITVPGDYSDDGRPTFHKRASFKIFAVSDSISLFSSVAAIIIFFSVLTARYSEHDFLYSVPTKFMWGLVILFLSVTALMTGYDYGEETFEKIFKCIYASFGSSAPYTISPDSQPFLRSAPYAEYRYQDVILPASGLSQASTPRRFSSLMPLIVMTVFTGSLIKICDSNASSAENEERAELVSFLKAVPSVEFCCVYDSSLHPNNKDKSAMVDYILGVSDPLQWHSQVKNLKMNADHYASWLRLLGGAKLVFTQIADEIGVGVHFNPFVTWNDKMLKYRVVRTDDLVQDILNWEKFYLSCRVQKPVHILVDNLDIANTNSVNLRAALSAALLLSPSKFTQEDLFAKICSLSYMGDLRMLFAEDKNKVKKIVLGQFDLFHLMYKPFLEEYEAKDFLRVSSSGTGQANISQDCGLPVTCSLVSSLPPAIKSQMGMKLGEKKRINEYGRAINEVITGSREEAAKCMQKVLRRTVMVSSARQAVSGLLAVGGINATRYLANKMQKAWKSWT
ncbi:uncharacterized protein LOC116108658 [Pistacia vera]|uniref:uncharacterized protein LOC116108658 n=1 Tax=Pistacia vera TaxID=55513 RepID=UPI001262E75F|nr:uncharacterized protein LOC116108658 [Pistacia vera]